MVKTLTIEDCPERVLSRWGVVRNSRTLAKRDRVTGESTRSFLTLEYAREPGKSYVVFWAPTADGPWEVFEWTVESRWPETSGFMLPLLPDGNRFYQLRAKL